MWQGGSYFYLGKKQMQELFFSKLRRIFFKSCVCMVISSDIIKSQAKKCDRKASPHQVNFVSSLMYKTYTFGARKLAKKCVNSGH